MILKNHYLIQEKKKNYQTLCLSKQRILSSLTRIENTYAEDTIQEISLYGVPSVSIAKEHARWKSVSDIVYTFTINEEQFLQVANEKADLENIADENRDKFINSLRLSESERYYFRDINSEPYSYDFTITSQHILSSKEIFMQSCVILMKKN